MNIIIKNNHFYSLTSYYYYYSYISLNNDNNNENNDFYWWWILLINCAYNQFFLNDNKKRKVKESQQLVTFFSDSRLRPSKRTGELYPNYEAPTFKRRRAGVYLGGEWSKILSKECHPSDNSQQIARKLIRITPETLKSRTIAGMTRNGKNKIK